MYNSELSADNGSSPQFRNTIDRFAAIRLLLYTLFQGGCGIERTLGLEVPCELNIGTCLRITSISSQTHREADDSLCARYLVA